ncbi:RNA-binding S4 domain-containing protein [Thermoleptolyngbya sp.]|jgi:ribosome-associated protein
MSSESSAKTIKLDQFLKWVNAVPTGGEAKVLIQIGEVSVNGEVETRRGRKLFEGDRVSVAGEEFIVNLT